MTVSRLTEEKYQLIASLPVSPVFKENHIKDALRLNLTTNSLLKRHSHI